MGLHSLGMLDECFPELCTGLMKSNGSSVGGVGSHAFIHAAGIWRRDEARTICLGRRNRCPPEGRTELLISGKLLIHPARDFRRGGRSVQMSFSRLAYNMDIILSGRMEAIRARRETTSSGR